MENTNLITSDFIRTINIKIFPLIYNIYMNLKEFTYILY